MLSQAPSFHVSLTPPSQGFDRSGLKLYANICLFLDGQPSMSLPRIFPAMSLSLVAFLDLTPVFADDAASSRPADWAQPVETQYNRLQMSPTLYRSAVPDEGALPLLEKLKV